jgi:muramoyltetrapeptide carboxypeptidase
MPNAAKRNAYLAGTDEERASDLMAAFADPSIDGILCARGGYGCARLLPLLKFEVIAANPKLLMGFSDITVLLNVIYQKTGLVGLYSPMLTSNLLEAAEEPELAAYTQAQWLRVMQATQIKDQAPFEVPNLDAYQCLWPEAIQHISPEKIESEATGTLLGGNLTLLASLCGTPWQPNFEGAVLFLEDWRERFYSLDRQWVQLQQAGLFNGIKGLLLCDFSDMPPEPHLNLELPAFFKALSQTLQVPVGYGFSVGHGQQTATLPMGVSVCFHAQQGRLQVLQAPVC